jgi:hypothetical protein
VEQAHLLIRQAEALGEAPDDPLLLFYVLYGLWVAHYVAIDGDVMRELAAEFLALAFLSVQSDTDWRGYVANELGIGLIVAPFDAG